LNGSLKGWLNSAQGNALGYDVTYFLSPHGIGLEKEQMMYAAEVKNVLERNANNVYP
jgi:hypothetical protein